MHGVMQCEYRTTETISPKHPIIHPRVKRRKIELMELKLRFSFKIYLFICIFLLHFDMMTIKQIFLCQMQNAKKKTHNLNYIFCI